MLRVLWAILALIAILATTLGFLGPWLGMADAFAVLRFPAVLALALLLLPVMRKPWLVLPALALSAFGLVSTLAPFVEAQAPGPVTLYQKNLSFRMADRSALLADIQATMPDIITLQEVTEAHRTEIFAALSEAYPTQAFCPFAGVGGTAVLSRWPAATPPVCPVAKGATVQPLSTPFGRITAISVHLHWPWPYSQRAQLEALIPELQGLTGSVLLGKDFNMVPWGWPVTATAKATRTERAGPPAMSFLIEGLLPIPIDHAFAPGGGQIERRPKLGSDHFGLLARLQP